MMRRMLEYSKTMDNQEEEGHANAALLFLWTEYVRSGLWQTNLRVGRHLSLMAVAFPQTQLPLGRKMRRFVFISPHRRVFARLLLERRPINTPPIFRN